MGLGWAPSQSWWVDSNHLVGALIAITFVLWVLVGPQRELGWCPFESVVESNHFCVVVLGFVFGLVLRPALRMDDVGRGMVIVIVRIWCCYWRCVWCCLRTSGFVFGVCVC